jgi:hypothetical protein
MERALELMARPDESAAQPAPETDTAASDAADQAPAAHQNSIAQHDANDEHDSDYEPNSPFDQGDEEAGDSDQGDALPLIAAPASWKDAEKEVWPSLPRAAQEAIARREQDRTSELRNLQNSSAGQRKAAEAEVNRLKGLSGQIDAHLHDKMAALAREFPDVKSEADLARIARENPARAQLLHSRLTELNAVALARKAAHAEIARSDQKHYAEHLARAKDALLEAFPAWHDPDTARREITALQDYAIGQGAPEAAARNALDPVIYRLAQKAMAYDRALAQRESAVSKTPPRVLKPGAQASDHATAARDESRRAKLGKLDRTGDLEDARGLLLT